LTEEEVWKKIEEGYKLNGEDNQIKCFLGDNLLRFYPRRALDWWIYDLKQFKTVPRSCKDGLLGFVKRTFKEVLSPYEHIYQVKELENEKFDKFIILMLTIHCNRFEEFIPHINNL